MENFTDEELVSNYLETHQNDYFNQLYGRYCQKVHRKCLSFTKDPTQAEDLTQDIFLRLIGKLDGYKRQAKFSTWLYSITFNHCADHVRSPRYRQEISGNNNWESMHAATDDTTEREEAEARLIQQAMAQLSMSEQTLLRHKYQDDTSIRDLALAHSLTESAVKMRLKRSRDRLRRHYWELATE